MRGMTSTLAGLVLLAVAGWTFIHGGSTLTVVVAGGGALFLIYHGYQGLTLTEATGDAMLPIELVTDPRGAIIDLATDRAASLIDDVRGTPAEPEEVDRSFDPDAIIARYMENRAGDPPATDRPAPSGRTFGRKGA